MWLLREQLWSSCKNTKDYYCKQKEWGDGKVKQPFAIAAIIPFKSSTRIWGEFRKTTWRKAKEEKACLNLQQSLSQVPSTSFGGKSVKVTETGRQCRDFIDWKEENHVGRWRKTLWEIKYLSCSPLSLVSLANTTSTSLFPANKTSGTSYYNKTSTYRL